jgi:hypothetical protein
MVRTLAHTAVLGLGILWSSLAVADNVDAMHPGLNGFRPGVGNELDAGHEPYVQMQQRQEEEDLRPSQWGRYEEREPGFGASDCRTAMTDDEESPVNFGYMACSDSDMSYQQPAGRWGFAD